MTGQSELRHGETATGGPRLGIAEQRPKMRLVSWKPVAKGRLRGYMKTIPTALITDTLAALTGAALAIEQQDA